MFGNREQSPLTDVPNVEQFHVDDDIFFEERKEWLLGELPVELQTRWRKELEGIDDKQAVATLEDLLSKRSQVLQENAVIETGVVINLDLHKELQEVNTMVRNLFQQEKYKLGEGDYGSVSFIPVAKRVAIKFLTDLDQTDRHKNAIDKEVALLDNLHGYSVGGVRAPYAYGKGVYLKNGMETAPCYYMCMERIDGLSVRQIIESLKDGQKSEEVEHFVNILSRQSKEDVTSRLQDFLRSMHKEKKCMQGDMHAGNVMLDSNGDWFVIDFGKGFTTDFAEEDVLLDPRVLPYVDVRKKEEPEEYIERRTPVRTIKDAKERELLEVLLVVNELYAALTDR